MPIRQLSTAMTLLFLAVYICAATEGIEATGSVQFHNFAREYYNEEYAEISQKLVPCACISSKQRPNLNNVLDALGETPSEAGATFSALNVAEDLLYDHMLELFTIGKCDVGLEYVRSAKSAPKSKETGFITSFDADEMRVRVNNVLDIANKKCCNAGSSTFVYSFMDTSLTFDEAQQDAESRGGFLARILTRHDAVNFYNTLLQSRYDSPNMPTVNGSHYVWTGLVSDATGSNWKWTGSGGEFLTDGENVENWGVNQPPQDASHRMCGVATAYNTATDAYKGTAGSMGQWSTLSCSQAMPYIMAMHKADNSSSGSSSDHKTLIIIIAVLLGLFLIASLLIVVKRIVGDSNTNRVNSGRLRGTRRSNSQGSRGSAGRRRRSTRNTRQEEVDEAEMDERTPATTGDGGSASHPPSHQRRRVRFPAQGNEDNMVGGRGSQYQVSDGSPTRIHSGTAQSPPRPGEQSAAYPMPTQDVGLTSPHRAPAGKNDPEQQQQLAVERARKLQQMRQQREEMKRQNAASTRGQIDTSGLDGMGSQQGSSMSATGSVSVFQGAQQTRQFEDLSRETAAGSSGQNDNQSSPVRYPVGGGGGGNGGGGGHNEDPMAFLDDVSIGSSQHPAATAGDDSSATGSFSAVSP